MTLMCTMSVTALSRNAIKLNYETVFLFYRMSLIPTDKIKDTDIETSECVLFHEKGEVIHNV